MTGTGHDVPIRFSKSNVPDSLANAKQFNYFCNTIHRLFDYICFRLTCTASNLQQVLFRARTNPSGPFPTTGTPNLTGWDGPV